MSDANIMLSLLQLMLFGALAFTSAYDVLCKTIPNMCVVAVLLLLTLVYPFNSQALLLAIGVLGVLMLWEKKRGRHLIGGGDLKLLGVLLPFLAPLQMGMFLMVAGVVALAVCLIIKAEKVPLAPIFSLVFVLVA